MPRIEGKKNHAPYVIGSSLAASSIVTIPVVLTHPEYCLLAGVLGVYVATGVCVLGCHITEYTEGWKMTKKQMEEYGKKEIVYLS